MKNSSFLSFDMATNTVTDLVNEACVEHLNGPFHIRFCTVHAVDHSAEVRCFSNE